MGKNVTVKNAPGNNKLPKSRPENKFGPDSNTVGATSKGHSSGKDKADSVLSVKDVSLSAVSMPNKSSKSVNRGVLSVSNESGSKEAGAGIPITTVSRGK